MASNPDFVQFILDQCAAAGPVSAKLMFGDDCLYCADKPVGLICDNNLYLKPLPELRPLLKSVELQSPYDGAKPHYLIPDVDNADYLASLIKTSFDLLPAPKTRKKK